MSITHRLRGPGGLFLAAGLLVLIVVSAALGIKDTPSRPSVEAVKHPEAVLITCLGANGQEAQGCGALIAPRVVLTAGHCLEGFEEWVVTAPYAKGGPVIRRSKSARIYPPQPTRAYEYENDLGVLILEREIELGQDYPKLYEGNRLPLQTRLRVVGRVKNGTVSTSKMYLAQVELMAIPDNLNALAGHPEVTEPGDSGGPVYAARNEKEIVGLVRGRMNGNRFYRTRDVYVLLDPAKRAWIRKQIRD